MVTENAAPATQKVSSVISTFRPTKLFKSPTLQYTSLDFDDSGELLLLARTDDSLQLYNTKAGAHAKELRSQKYGCALARFTHHAQSLLYASTKVDHGIRYLSTHDDSFIRYFKGHTDRVTCLTMCPGNDTFLSASQDNTVKLWDLKSASAQGSLNLQGATLTAYDPSATVIAIASPATHSILLYDLRLFDKPPFATFDLLETERRLASTLQQSDSKTGTWTTLEFSNNGEHILVGTSGPCHYLLNAFDGNLKAYLHLQKGPVTLPSRADIKDAVPLDTAGVQGGCCFSPDGRYVMSAHAQPGLVVWDTQAEVGADKMLPPSTELPSAKAATVVGYNPRHNMVASAASEVVLWLPDPDLQ